MSTGKLWARYDNKNLWCPVKSNDVLTPRLAVRHNSENLYAPLNTSAVKPRLAVFVNGSTKYISLLSENLVSWLRFDESATKDECGNTWTAADTATVSADNAIFGKALTGGQITLDTPIMLGGQDFTVDFWFGAFTNEWQRVFIYRYGESSSGGAGGLFGVQQASDGRLSVWTTVEANSTRISSSHSMAHYAIVYQHSAKTMKVYKNGILVVTRTDVTINRTGHTVQIGLRFPFAADEFRVYDGIARWTSDFTPPTAADYS